VPNVKLAAALAALTAVSGCASGRVVRLEKDVEELRESLAQAEKRDSELTAQIEKLRQESQAMRQELAQVQPGGISPAEPAATPTRPGPVAEAAEPQPPQSEMDLELPQSEPSSNLALEPPEPGGTPVIQGTPGKKPAVSSPAQDVSMLSSADDLYAEAFANFQKAAYHKSILQFNVFVERYPHHDLTDNAFYWIGECWYGLRNYPRAIAAFDIVLQRFPKGNKAPDSLLKKAFSLQRSGKARDALEAFQELIRRYPKSTSAAKAQVKIKEMQESQS
jgi:tol-pal system protein YbgF